MSIGPWKMRISCSCFDIPGDEGDRTGVGNGFLKGVWNKKRLKLDDLTFDLILFYKQILNRLLNHKSNQIWFGMGQKWVMPTSHKSNLLARVSVESP